MKDLVEMDIKHRFPGYTFEEVNKGDMNCVILRDDQGEKVFESLRNNIDDAYSNIRENVVDSHAACRTTAAERASLTNVPDGMPVQDVDTGALLIYNGNDFV